MRALIPIDLQQIIENVKAEGKSRQVLWQDSESLAFLSSGRKDRKDFHIDPSDEITLQLSGVQNLVYLAPDGRQQTATLHPGQMILCPAGVPHSPRVEGNAWFIVFERKRKPGEHDRFIWFCEKCGERVYEASVAVGDYRDDPVSQVHHQFYSNESLRTCKHCGATITPPP